MFVVGLDIGDFVDDVVRVDGLVVEMCYDFGGFGFFVLFD